MDWPGYKFHKESEPELLEFLKVVAEQKSHNSPPPDIKAIWEKVLPIEESLQEKLIALQNSSETEVIDITESDDEDIKGEASMPQSTHLEKEDTDFLLPEQSFMQLTENESNTIRTTEELVNEVQDLLEAELFLPEHVIQQLGECSSQQLQDIFTVFANDLNSETTLRLWKSFITSSGAEHITIAENFTQYILVQKILNKCDPVVAELLQKVFEAFPEVSRFLLRIILETTDEIHLKKLRDNISSLPVNYKNMLLRQFEDNCPKLESHHLGTILCLLTTQTEITCLNKLVDMMSNVAKEFATEKTYGKLLLEVIQLLGVNVVHCEDQLKYIMAIHKSVFKTQIMNTIKKTLEDQKMLSQSFRL